MAEQDTEELAGRGSGPAEDLEAADRDADTLSDQPVDGTVVACDTGTGGGTAPGNLEVTVTDSNTNQPIANAKVSIQGPQSKTGTTDASGKVTFSGLKPGAYTIKAEAPSYSTENGTATVASGKTATVKIPLTPITVAIAFDQPVGCPGHLLKVTATGTPGGGTFAWELTGANLALVDGSGAAATTGATLNVLGFLANDNTGEILELNGTLKVTYTFTNGQTATDTKDVKIHGIKFDVTNTTINKSDTLVTETTTTVTIGRRATATMSTNPSVKIKLDASCPRKTDCAKNHRAGCMQTVGTDAFEIRFTDSKTAVTVPLPLRDNLNSTQTKPFYDEPKQFTGDNDTQTVHHEDSPGITNVVTTDPRPGAPAPPPVQNRRLRYITRRMGFTVWLVVQNIEWSVRDLGKSFAYQGNFDWSMGITVNMDFTKTAGSQANPTHSTPTVPAAFSNGKGGGSPTMADPSYNAAANDPANQTFGAAPTI